MPPIDFTEFMELPFPEHGDIVYVLCYAAPGATDFTPFYVGQSSRNIGRFGDYVSAKFSASTDFKVGTAVRHFRQLGCKVIIRYKSTTDKRSEEQELLRLYENAGLSLLNRLEGYNYNHASEEDEQRKVLEFVSRLLAPLQR